MTSVNWINLGPGGTFRPTGDLSSTPADVDALTGARMMGKDRLILHFHGGLVDEANGRRIADAMAANYGDAALSIGLVWETGLLETYRDNLRKIADTKVFRKALSWIVAKALERIGDDSGARGRGGPVNDPRAIEVALLSDATALALDSALTAQIDASSGAGTAKGTRDEADEQIETIAFDLKQDWSSDPSLVVLVEGDPEAAPIRDQLPEEGGAKNVSVASIAWFVGKVILAVVRRYRGGTEHDLLPTAIEELLRAAYVNQIGAFAWEQMKRKALEMWTDDGPSPQLDAHVGGYLLRCLEQLQKDRPEVTIDLVGHSAGSIAICHLLAQSEAQHRAIRFRNVLFLAPAARLDLFAAQIVRHNPQFARFRMFTMADSSEKADRMAGALYPRSLLYFISGVLEDRPGSPLAGQARHILAATASAGSDFDDVRGWLRSENRLALAPSADDAAEGLRTRSARHGDFDDDPSTLASLLHLANMQS